jgi:L-alanine-DL-glutamate epimerase-like enolase superfamily enzyme
MSVPSLTFKHMRARPIALKLKRPVAARIGTLTDWRHRIAGLYDLGELLKGGAVRKAVGDDVHLMVDFNQGPSLGEALHRSHMIDDLGLAWIEEPIVYDNLEGTPGLPRS